MEARYGNTQSKFKIAVIVFWIAVGVSAGELVVINSTGRTSSCSAHDTSLSFKRWDLKMSAEPLSKLPD